MPLRVPRPQAGDYLAGDYEAYIGLVPADRDMVAVYSEQEADVDAFYRDLTEEQAAHRYAEGKWSLKEMLGHVIDNERIMSYRLLCIARGETASLPGYHDTAYVTAASFDTRTVPDLLSEFHAVRPGTIALVRSLTDEQLRRAGTANQARVTAGALVYIIVGHAMHHMNIARERYIRR